MFCLRKVDKPRQLIRSKDSVDDLPVPVIPFQNGYVGKISPTKGFGPFAGVKARWAFERYELIAPPKVLVFVLERFSGFEAGLTTWRFLVSEINERCFHLIKCPPYEVLFW